MSVRRPLFSVLWLLPLGWLWFVLINDLRVEWTVNPQYGYCWAVPFLCVYLAFRKISDLRPQLPGLKSPVSGLCPSSSALRPPWTVVSSLVVLCLAYAPTRLIQEANPGWRLVSWALAIEVIGITFCVLRLALAGDSGQSSVARRPSSALRPPFSAFRFLASAFQLFSFSAFVFPLCFFLVAVPWPTWLEETVIQGLTRADASAAVELLGWLGIPAMPHGNIIEVATGTVGIDEACSGIRSFQATLMISLFLGQVYQLSVVRRAVLCGCGFALSFFFNLARMTLLVGVAARQGVPAVASWHDPAGVTILLGCFLGLWGVGVLLGGKGEERRKEKEEGSQGPAVRGQTSDLRSPISDPRPSPAAVRHPASAFSLSAPQPFSFSAFQPFSFLALALWLLLTEVCIEGWYRAHEARLPRAVQWVPAWPADNPTFKELTLPPRTRQILRYDEGRSAAWGENSLAWQVIFLRWNPGRTALHLAQGHTPEVCLTAAGHNLKVISPLQWIAIGGSPVTTGGNSDSIRRPPSTLDPSPYRSAAEPGQPSTPLRLPFAIYEVTDNARPCYVFYCLWGDRSSLQGFETMSLNRFNRLAPVCAGIRNPGQRSLEIALTGPETATEAETALCAELSKLIRTR